MLATWLGWEEQWSWNHPVTFDGENSLIYIAESISSLRVKEDLYSNWKEWVRLYDNAKFLPAFRVIGGDAVAPGLYAGDIYFLTNGWKIVVDHAVDIQGILYNDTTGVSPYIIEPGGGVFATVSHLAYGVDATGTFTPPTPAEIWSYNTRTLTDTPIYNGPSAADIRQEIDSQSTQLAAINTKVSALPTAQTIAAAVKTELNPELTQLAMVAGGLTPRQATMLTEIYTLYGLDPTKPLVVTTHSRVAGEITQSIGTSASQTVVTRN